MICIVRIFGAPVIDPQGNSARIKSTRLVPSHSTDSTVDVICQTVSKRSRSNNDDTRTLPGTETLPRSLRSRSTIITFSARFFSEYLSHSAMSRSSASQRPRGAVPFIGFVTT
jgi:hypothetical protein